METLIGQPAPRTRLRLEQVSQTIVAEVAARETGRMTVTQALPFLELGSSVRDEGGRSAQIEAVRLSVVDGTPQIVLDIVYDDERAASARDDDTYEEIDLVPDAQMTAPYAMVTVAREEDELDVTQVFRTHRVEDAASDPAPRPNGAMVLAAPQPSVWARFAAWIGAVAVRLRFA